MSNLSTAIKIQEATAKSVQDDLVIHTAKEMLSMFGYDDLEDETLIRAVYRYSALLAATVATNITSVLLTESEFHSMISEVNEMSDITKQVMGE